MLWSLVGLFTHLYNILMNPKGEGSALPAPSSLAHLLRQFGVSWVWDLLSHYISKKSAKCLLVFKRVNIPLQKLLTGPECGGKKPAGRKHLRKVKGSMCVGESYGVLLILSFCVFGSWMTQSIFWVCGKMQECVIHNVMNFHGIRMSFRVDYS